MKTLHLSFLPKDGLKKVYFWAEREESLQDKNSLEYKSFSCIPQLELSNFFQSTLSSRENWNFENIFLFLPTYNQNPLSSRSVSSDFRDKNMPIQVQECLLRTISIEFSFLWKFFPKLWKSFPEIIDESFEGIERSDSIFFLKDIVHFVLQLLREQSFFPLVRKETRPSECSAIWTPYLSEGQKNVFKDFAHSMPKCLVAFSEKEVSEREIQKFLWTLIKELMDSFIRSHIHFYYLTHQINSSLGKKIQISEKWIKALFAPNRVVKGNPKEIDLFIHNVSEWMSMFSSDFFSPISLCFEISPPEDDVNESADWILTYHLQCNWQKEKMISSSQFFEQKETWFGEKDYAYSQALTFIKKDLQRASKIVPLLAPLLNMAQSPSITITKKEAWFFLSKGFSLLSHAGYRILWPQFWTDRDQEKMKMIVKLDENFQKKKVVYVGLNTFFKINMKISWGGYYLSEEEIQNVMQTKNPLIRLKDEWTFVDIAKIKENIKYFSQTTTNQLEISLKDFFLLYSQNKNDVDMKSDSDLIFNMSRSSKNSILSILDGESIEEITTPKAFQGELRPYQKLGVSWLLFLQKIGIGGCLADDMGLGKTIQVIALLLKEKELKLISHSTTLILCPMSILNNWKKELEFFAPELKILVYHGTTRSPSAEFLKTVYEFDVVITTYSLVVTELECLKNINWYRIVLDEAQNIKNALTQQTKAIKTLKAKYKIAMTGTPLENQLLELWSIMDFLNPHYLGSSKEFYTSYCVPIEKYNDQKVSEELKKKISPFILRRLKTDKKVIKDLPSKIEMDESCYLTDEQIRLYQSVFKEIFETIHTSKGIYRRGIVLSLFIKLKQICNHPASYLKDDFPMEGRSGKLIRLIELLKEVSDLGEKSLIFTQFTQMGHLLQKFLKKTFGVEILFLHGMVSKKKRDEMIEKFQMPDSPYPLFVLSLKAGGLGLNLTSANHVFHFDRWWNPATENQATDRSFRIGQKKIVYVHKLLCEGTIEQKINEMVIRKQHLSNLIIGKTPSQLFSTLSNDEIYNLCQLNMGSH